MPAASVYDSFVAACTSADQVAARELSTEDGWNAGGIPVRRLVEQIRGRNVSMRQSGPLREHEQRAAVPTSLGQDSNAQHYWVLMCATGALWQIDGIADSWDSAGLYVHGKIDRVPSFAELPDSEAAAHWFNAYAGGATPDHRGASGQMALELLNELRTSATELRLVRAVGLQAARRFAVGIAFEQQDGGSQTVWALLEAHERTGMLSLIDRSFSASTSHLVRGVDPIWPPHEEQRDAPVYTAQEATDIFQEALEFTHKEQSRVTGSDSPLGGRMGEILSDLFQTMMDPEQRPEPSERGKPGIAEQRLAKNVSDAMRDFMSSTRIDDERTVEDLRIDSDFVRDNGSELLSSLVGALTGAVIPKDLGIDLGPTEPTGESTDNKRVRIDVGDLLAGLFSPPPRPDTE